MKQRKRHKLDQVGSTWMELIAMHCNHEVVVPYKETCQSWCEKQPGCSVWQAGFCSQLPQVSCCSNHSCVRCVCAQEVDQGGQTACFQTFWSTLAAIAIKKRTTGRNRDLRALKALLEIRVRNSQVLFEVRKTQISFHSDSGFLK